jgi:hypothetical protein
VLRATTMVATGVVETSVGASSRTSVTASTKHLPAAFAVRLSLPKTSPSLRNAVVASKSDLIQLAREYTEDSSINGLMLSEATTHFYRVSNYKNRASQGLTSGKSTKLA